MSVDRDKPLVRGHLRTLRGGEGEIQEAFSAHQSALCCELLLASTGQCTVIWFIPRFVSSSGHLADDVAP